MCKDQVRLEEMITPRYLKKSTWSIGQLLVKKDGREVINEVGSHERIIYFRLFDIKEEKIKRDPRGDEVNTVLNRKKAGRGGNFPSQENVICIECKGS